MSARISLDGNWQFKEFYGEDWLWRDAHKPDTRDSLHWRQGNVPGCVHNDLWTLGEIPNPYFERNSLLLEWIPARTWIYKRIFFVEETLRGKTIHLHFDGVDYEAQFFLNGERLGGHRGMYTPAIFDITNVVHYGTENLVAVVIEAAPFEQPQVSRTSKVRTHKSRMTYWWDFCPRMTHIGIWDRVHLHISDGVRIADVFVRPQPSDNFDRANIVITLQLDTIQAQDIELQFTLTLDDHVVTQQRLFQTASVGYTELDVSLQISEPCLWWPNGYGEQPLYALRVEIFSSKAVSLDDRVIRFGIRQIELVRNETSDPMARPYTFIVNGRKIYLKGWNWVPIDVMYGVERPEKLAHLLYLSQRAHVNLLRVWGGGLIEKDAFYEKCDELGIMVWQEFAQSSSGIENNPSDSPEFIEMMVREAEQIIPRKRNHPSLVIWCGGNELTSAPEQPLDNSHPLLETLKSTVNRLAPDHIWLPTSPTGRAFMNSLENIERDPLGLHDVHGPWEYQGVTAQYELYNRSTSLLHSEFGVEGVTNLKTLNATIAPEHQWPPTLDNVYWFHLGAWWNKQPMWRAIFGDLADIETLVRATQFIQAEGLRYALEADRRRKYQNSGTIPWQFNEPYPMATCTSAVDYNGQPKPSYYAVARAYEPVIVSARFPTIAWQGSGNFEAEIWANNSHDFAFIESTMQIQIVGCSGHVYFDSSEKVSIEANSAARLAAVQWPLNELRDWVFFLDMSLQTEDGQTLSRNRYPFTSTHNLSSLLDIPLTDLRIEKEETDTMWRLAIKNTGNQAALWVWLEDGREIGTAGNVYFQDNHFCLLPQEARSIVVLWRNVSSIERKLTVSGWNMEQLNL